MTQRIRKNGSWQIFNYSNGTVQPWEGGKDTTMTTTTGGAGGVDDAAALSLPLGLIWAEVQDCARVARSNKAWRTG